MRSGETSDVKAGAAEVNAEAVDANAEATKVNPVADLIARVPQDVLALILSYSKNPSTFFYVNKAFRSASFHYLLNDLITWEPGKTYYTVAGGLNSHNDDAEIPFYQSRIDEVRERFLSPDTGFSIELREFKNLQAADLIFLKQENITRLTLVLKCNEDIIGQAVLSHHQNSAIQILEDSDIRENVF